MLIFLAAIETPEDTSKAMAVYERYWGLMYSEAYKILGNQQDAEDAVGAAVEKIIDQLEKISDPESPSTKSFVVTIVKNKARDHYRRKQRHPQIELLEEMPGDPVEYEGENRLTQCILNLPDRYRDWIMARYGEDGQERPMVEMADLFDLTMDAAYKLDQRAKKKLEALCREEGIL